MNTKKSNTETLHAKILWWTALVLILSCLCYLPMLLEKNGIPVSQIALNLKYLFVIVPLTVSIVFSFQEKYFKKWVLTLFTEKVKFQAILSCIILGCIGLSFSAMYCLIMGEMDLFTSSYPTALAVVLNCSYLFVTALLEEMAWRGFLLNKIAAVEEKKFALIYVGIVWAVWHIPMWAIRNSLGFKEILIYFIWTIAISFILGICFFIYKNILIVSLSHMIFNTCFILPVKFGVIPLGCILILMFFHFYHKN